MARPLVEFTEKEIKQLETLARCHCPDTEIAAFMGCGVTTIQRRFGALLKEAREAGRANIRAKQYELAMKGDRTMLIWLGKQLLGQQERATIEIGRLPDIVLEQEMEKRIAEREREVLELAPSQITEEIIEPQRNGEPA